MLKKAISLLMVLTMLAGCLCVSALADGRYTAEATDDGWIRVVQDGGPTLGYREDSGVTLLEEDGYAFKDLNKNGELDPYEDWRLSADDRAADLASRLSIHEMSGIRSSLAVFSLGDGQSTPLMSGDKDLEQAMTDWKVRTVLTYVSSAPIKDQVKWNNHLQSIGEADDYGIPMIIDCDPRNDYSSGVSNLAVAATFDTDAAREEFIKASRSYRQLGITQVLGPQIDTLTEPRWQRATGTMGEDPALARDMANAVISGYQSTYDAEGNDLGWGEESVLGMMKHWPGDGAAEAGRESHSNIGAYQVYPGDGFEVQQIAFIDGAMALDSATQTVAGVMSSYSVSYSGSEEYGELVGSAWSEYKNEILRSHGFDGMISTGGLMDSTYHGVEDLTMEERAAKMVAAGTDQALWVAEAPELIESAYDALCEEIGEEEAQDNYYQAARRILRNMSNVGLFENPYVEAKAAEAYFKDDSVTATVTDFAKSSIVMLKNSDGTIHESSGEKLKVYVPYVYGSASMGPGGGQSGWHLPVNLKTLNQYFDVVTDQVVTAEAESAGAPEEGSSEPTEEVVRASEEDLQDCAYAIAFISSPNSGNGYDSSTQTYVPISLQYGEYTADGVNVRDESISGNLTVTQIENPYGVVETYEKENRSYYGETVVASNIGDLELVQWLKETVPETTRIIVCVDAANPMIFSEIEPLADVILLGFGIDDNNFAALIAGEYEPRGLLPAQMPADMDTVEEQYEDIPRDMECYVDADGNTYDFAFGLNWSGVIDDERVAIYNVPVLLELQ